MLKILRFFIILSMASCSTHYYIVRHAEKAIANSVMTSDVPLSAVGQERAEALKQELLNKKIRHIYSTNYVRTRQTVQPLAVALGLPVEIYDPKDILFIKNLQKLKGNSLIVGHSNTVDDLVNGLSGKAVLSDLPDSAYGDIYIVLKKGKNWNVQKKHFGN